MQLPVETVRDIIYLRSAQLVARRMFHVANLADRQADEHGYVVQIFHDLKAGRWHWADALGASQQAEELGDQCVFCGSRDELMAVELVPQSMTVNEHCPECPGLTEPANRVQCCATCRAMKAGEGLYKTFSDLFPERVDFQEMIPDGVERSYLRTVYRCHECAGTLNGGDLDGDGELTLLDVDQVVARHAG